MSYSSRLRVIATLVVTAVSCALPAHAALRSPQVPVSGTALQAFFTAQGQSINASADQQDFQTFSLPASSSFDVHSFVSNPAIFFGMYNAGEAVPALNVLPAAASPGWFYTVAFRTAPQRAVVNLFDGTATLAGTNTYVGADNTNFGFFTQGNALFYTQDARNPGAAPQILAFAGTGSRAGSTWFACETSAGAGGEFADVIVLVSFSALPVPTNSTTWSRVKALYK
jgi:hypothetical protein